MLWFAAGIPYNRRRRQRGADVSATEDSDLVNTISTLYRSLVAGTICSVLVLSFSVADAALLFRGNLSQYLVIAVALAIFGYLTQIVVIGSFTRLKHAHGTSQEACIVIVSAMIVSVQGQVSEAALLPTALALIALSGLSLGVAFTLCGVLSAGRYIRLMPFPMVAGFLAGSGLLLMGFAVSVLHGEDIGWRALMQGDSMPAVFKVGVGLAMGVALVLIGSMRWSEYTLPLLVIGGVVGFHAVVAVTPIDLSALVAADWTMSREAVSVTYQPLTPALIKQVDWHAVAVTSPQLLSLVAVCVFASLIKISSLELMMRQRVDENRELRVAGLANLIGGICALAPGFHGLSNSGVVTTLRGSAKLSALVCVVVTVGCVVLAGDTLVQMPRFVFGAILLWCGYGMVYDSLILNLGKLRAYESVVTLLIALAVVVFGFLPGLAFGVVCGLLMFATEYGKLETVRSFQSVAELHSNVDRTAAEQAVLNRHGQAVRVVRLHSYLFFGSAARSVDQITSYLDRPENSDVSTLILDLSRVTGIDSTALRAFQRLTLRTETGGIRVWGCGASQPVRNAFEKDGNGSIAAFHDTLDLALEAAENKLLALHEPFGASGMPDADQPDQVLAQLFWDHGMPLSLRAGETVLNSGEPSRGLFWVVSGVLDAQVHTSDGDLRVRRMGPGALIGEISWYLQQSTSARVVAVEEASLLHLDTQAMARLGAEDPERSAQLHTEIARILSFRLVDNTRQLRQLS